MNLRRHCYCRLVVHPPSTPSAIPIRETIAASRGVSRRTMAKMMQRRRAEPSSEEESVTLFPETEHVHNNADWSRRRLRNLLRREHHHAMGKIGALLLLSFCTVWFISSQQGLLAAKRKEKFYPNSHIVISTGCNKYQDWQSYTFFYHAMTSKQPGTVTRIVSGCNEADEATLRKIFNEQIAPMAPARFKIHFTPDYSNLAKSKWSYVYFNKPFGMRHWMEQELGFPDNPVDEDAIIILLDPDQIIMRPFTNNDFSNTQWKYFNDYRLLGRPRTWVEHGKPMGQLYGLNLNWKHLINMTKVLPNETSPVDAMSNAEAERGYNVGPPYIATAKDMYSIVLRWCDFAVPVYNQYPNLLAEMFAYSLSAAHQGLAHQTAMSFMVSDVKSINEGWDYIERLPKDQICAPKSVEDVPNVFHFCQIYGLGSYYFYKRKIPNNILTCETPLLREPTADELDTNDVVWPDGKSQTWPDFQSKRSRFALCVLIPALNAAMEHYKRHHCNPPQANFGKTLTFHETKGS